LPGCGQERSRLTGQTPSPSLPLCIDGTLDGAQHLCALSRGVGVYDACRPSRSSPPGNAVIHRVGLQRGKHQHSDKEDQSCWAHASSAWFARRRVCLTHGDAGLRAASRQAYTLHLQWTITLSHAPCPGSTRNRLVAWRPIRSLSLDEYLQRTDRSNQGSAVSEQCRRHHAFLNDQIPRG
jgi:hypothetical protein